MGFVLLFFCWWFIDNQSGLLLFVFHLQPQSVSIMPRVDDFLFQMFKANHNRHKHLKTDQRIVKLFWVGRTFGNQVNNVSALWEANLITQSWCWWKWVSSSSRLLHQGRHQLIHLPKRHQRPSFLKELTAIVKKLVEDFNTADPVKYKSYFHMLHTKVSKTQLERMHDENSPLVNFEKLRDSGWIKSTVKWDWSNLCNRR